MLRLFRVRAWCWLTALVLAVGTSTAALDELLHAGTAHDFACAPGVDVAHDASSHRFQARADSGGHDGHCVACHFARASRVGAQSASMGEHADEARAPQSVPTIGSARAAALDSLPPRSPPRLS
jgi:mono/diheme cytochrome c family protein